MEIINVFLRERESLEIAKRTLELLEQAKAKTIHRLGHPNPKSLYNRAKESNYKQAEKVLRDYIFKPKLCVVVPRIVITCLKERYKLNNCEVFLLIRYKEKLLKLYIKNGTTKKKRPQTLSYPSLKK